MCMPKSRTDSASASSRSRFTAAGTLSPSSYTTKGRSVVSPVRAAASGAVRQSSYSGPTCRWQSINPGRTYLPVASTTRSARRRLREQLAERVDDAGAADQLDAVLDTGLGHADDEAEVGVGAGAHAQLVEVERERGDRRVVADQDDLGALERQTAITLRIAAVLADGDADLRAGAVEDLVAGVAVGEVIGLVDLGESVHGLRSRQVDLPEHAGQPAVAIGEERRVEVLAVGLLAEPDVDRDALFGSPAQQRLERLGRHLGLEELIEVGADSLGEVGRQRHLGIRDDFDVVADRLV